MILQRDPRNWKIGINEAPSPPPPNILDNFSFLLVLIFNLFGGMNLFLGYWRLQRRRFHLILFSLPLPFLKINPYGCGESHL